MTVRSPLIFRISAVALRSNRSASALCYESETEPEIETLVMGVLTQF